MNSDCSQRTPELSILIVCTNERRVIEGCLRSLRRVEDEANFEILMMDNASADGSVEFVRSEFPEVRILPSDRNLGFAAAMNVGFRAARGKILLPLNPDTLMPRGTLRRIVDFLRDTPQAAVAGATLTYANGQPQDSMFHFPSLPRELLNYLPELKTLLCPRRVTDGLRRLLTGKSAPDRPFRAPSISGAAFGVKAEVMARLQGFDEGFFVYHEERDFCRRVWNEGWEVWSLPKAQVIHLDATGTGYRKNRLPRMPLLGWRVGGMDRLWRKHRPGIAHGCWRAQTRALLWMRILFIFISLPFRGQNGGVARGRIRELRECLALLRIRSAAEALRRAEKPDSP